MKDPWCVALTNGAKTEKPNSKKNAFGKEELSKLGLILTKLAIVGLLFVQVAENKIS